MNYTITYTTDCVDFIPFKDDTCASHHIDIQTYKANTLDAAVFIVNDVLDAPLSEMTLEQVNKDFSDSAYPISEEDAIQIQNYFNGRLALRDAIIKELENNRTVTTLQYNIPEKYISLFNDDDDDDEHTKKSSAYIEIELTN